jgi:predicted dehydrogenase
MRIGVIGLGVIGRHHVDAIAARPGADLAAACDRRADLLRGHVHTGRHWLGTRVWG